MNDLPLIPFFNSANVSQFFQYVYAIMFVVMPILTIWAATVLGGDLLAVIRGVFSKRGSSENYEDDRYSNKKIDD